MPLERELLATSIRTVLRNANTEEARDVEEALRTFRTQFEEKFSGILHPPKKERVPYARKRYVRYADSAGYPPSIDWPKETIERDQRRIEKHMQLPEPQRLDLTTYWYKGQIENKLSPQEQMVLWAYVDKPKPLSVHDLVEKTFLTGAQVQMTLTHLVQKGFVEKQSGRPVTYRVADPELLKYLVFRANTEFGRR